MDNNEREFVIIRSRFQPFTTYHLDLIKKVMDSKKDVVLCIIRDYETISRYHRMSPEIKDVDLRHLPIFNPLTAWDLILHINRCLEKSFLNQYKNHILMVVSPLKFSELVEVLTSLDGLIIPEDIKKFVGGVYPCEPKDFKSCQVVDRLSKMLSITFYDSMPKESQWFFGLFDVEDARDAQKAKEKFIKEVIEVVLPNSPTYQLEDLTPPLGLYGMFCLWIYLQFVKRYMESSFPWKGKFRIKIPVKLNNLNWLKKQIDLLRNQLKDYLIDSEEWTFFENKVSDLIAEMLNRFEFIPEPERRVLLNYYEFKKLAINSIGSYKGKK